MKPEISLTTFVDFVIATPRTQVTCVRKAKDQYDEEYDPRFDFWKRLREAIVEMHERGAKPAALDRVLDGLSHEPKVARYPECIAGYRKWHGRKEFVWLGARTAKWTDGDVSVRVNPELGVRINGVPHSVKLYFKDAEPSKSKVDSVLYLISASGAGASGRPTPALLDVPRAKLYVPTVDLKDVGILLKGQAAAFAQIWNSLGG